MLHDNDPTVENCFGSFISSGLPDSVQAEMNEWKDRFNGRLTDEDIDAMWAREMERREFENVEPLDDSSHRRVLALKSRFDVMCERAIRERR